MKPLAILICAAIGAFAQTAPPPVTPAQSSTPQLEDGLYAVFNTEMGTITAKLFEKETPLTVANFVALTKGTRAWKDPKTGQMVKRPLYNGLGFHRVILDQMIQTGSAVANGEHDCGFKLKGEIRPELKFDRPGRLAMANVNSPDDAACQFFITQVSSAAPWNGAYTIFGQVVDGQDVVKQISRVPVKDRQSGLAKTPVKLTSVTIKRVGPEPVSATPAKKAVPAATTKATPAATTTKK